MIIWINGAASIQLDDVSIWCPPAYFNGHDGDYLINRPYWTRGPKCKNQ